MSPKDLEVTGNTLVDLDKALTLLHDKFSFVNKTLEDHH